MLKFINPEYMDYLFTTTLGNNILYAAAVLQLVGVMWIRNLLNFDN